MDADLIEELRSLAVFQHTMRGDDCVSLSFYDENSLWGGTIRHSPDKKKILSIVQQLSHLESLNLRKCKLKDIPSMTTSLSFLDISCNDLLELPSWVKSMPFLKFLNLGSNQIRFLPDLDDCKIETLKFHKNPILCCPALPPTLQQLNIYLVQFDIPSFVWELSDLCFLSYGTVAKNLSNRIGNLKKLRWLSLVANEFTSLPDEICNLSKLEGIKLTKNRINRLPTEIGDLQNLKEFSLYSNCLTDLPNSFYDLKLSKLNLAKNPLRPNVKARLSHWGGGNPDVFCVGNGIFGYDASHA